MDLSVKPIAEDDERKLKNLATRIMSNGVEVLVKDKSADAKQEQRKVKYILATSLKPHQMMSAPLQKTLLSSAVATFINNQHMSALFPIHQLMQHNYIIKTCMTTYTYLTTVVHNKRSAISTFETILSVVTTESLTNLYATDMLDIKPTKTKYLEVKTIQPTTPSNMFVSSFPKIDKRIDTPDDGENFDLIEPSEHGHVLCTTSCSCSHTKTEGLKTKYTNLHEHSMSASKYGMKTSKYGASKIDLRPTKVESFEKKTQYRPYEYEASQSAPTDRIVEKYTEVINDYSEEKESNSVEESELLTNEQAPVPTKTNKLSNKNQEKPKPDKPQKPNKNKVLVSDLLKLGSLGIKGLSQLAPVIEKMTGGFMKRNEPNKTTLTTTTTKPAEKLTPYNVNKRLDSELESKHTSFPIYIPVDELETSESQLVLTNATLHQNLAWAAEHKQSKAYIATPKVVHESPLVNGGIPISPGEIITANSDVIVGKPAVGGPLTLAASGIKLHNPVNPPPIDSFVAGSEQYLILEKPSLPENTLSGTKVDDSFDLRPPEPPKAVLKPNRLIPRPPASMYNHPNPPSSNKIHPRLPLVHHSDQMMKTEHIKTSVILGNHGRPAFLDYIPSLAKPSSPPPRQHHNGYKPVIENNNEDIPDNSPSSSEIVDSKVSPHGDVMSKPFLVDIQPSKVANVLIPHGSSTALVFAGSSEPHKTGEYVDDPLPYPEPGYFGSFSIDAPQMTNVHNVTPNNKHFLPKPSGHSTPMENYKTSNLPPFKEYSFRNDLKYKWKDNKRPIDYNKIPPPTSNQETHVQVGPHITVYNPDIYKPNNGEFEKYNHGHPNKYKDGKEVIDKEYENYLAVPPPPPKMHYNPESHFEKNKPYNQRPMVHTKPIQDMKVFLNIQHPIPKQPSQESQPPKVTSEIYYAAQATHNKPGPTYTIRVPPPPLTYGNIHTQPSSSPQHIPNNVVSHSSDSFTIVSSPDFSNKSVLTDDFQVNHKDNTYTVTLNTAANVANNVGETAQVIGTSIPVDVGTSNEADRLNTNIPIGTNFAIKVEDGSEHQDYERYNSQGNKNLQTIYNDDGLVTDVAIGDNRWNLSNIDQKVKVETKITSNNYYNQNYSDFNEYYDQTYPAPAPSLNSHANFPMMNEATTLMPYDTLKPVTEYVEEETTEQKRPAKLIPNIPTNSHGWYSSVLGNENSLNNMNKIIIEQPTTRKIIPLLHEYGNVPNFGQKITSVGKPPSEFWTQNQHTNTDQNKFSIGRPFTRTETTTDKATSHTSYFVVKPPDYIPSYFDGMQQPAYDIPIRDNSDETTTARIESFSEKEKPVYENTEEVYDGEEETANTGVEDGELSQESMKVPVVTTSSEDQTIHYVNKSATDISLLQDEVSKDKQANSNKKNLVEFDPGTQTEKPFTTSNKTMFHSNAMKPIYNQMRPRPFTTSTLTTLDHQLQQPHWQINQLMINSTNAASYEEGLDLNIGEEISLTKSTTRIPQTKPESENKFKRPTRPVYYSHEHENVSNIITSTVNIKNKKPLIVEKNSDKHISTLSPILLTTLEINRSSSEILDLSPPPPTLEYSFKPSTNDELIMGMSPPPPVTVPPRVPQRNHITSKPFLNRTPSNYRTKPPRTLPPRGPSTQRPIRRPISRDEISTYKPTYDVLNNIKRPVFNRDQPSSQLLPPPLDIPTRVIPINDLPSPTVNISTNQNVVFPTPLSSGWLTSSTIDFSSSFDFNPSSVQFPEVSQSTEAPVYEQASTEDSFSYEHSSSSERNEDNNSKKSTTESRVSVSKESSTEPISERPTFSEENVSDSFASETSQEDATTDKIKVIPIGHKNRTRRPYPVRHDDRKSSTNKYKIPSKSTPIIKPTRTLSRPDILFPTRHSSTRKIIRPIPTRSHSLTPSIIESSEHSIDDDFVKPTEVLKDSILPTSILAEKTSIFEKSASNTFTPNLEDDMTVQPIHHTGNEVKVSDEIIPTKTEFKTSVITLTKTLSEPPRTVSSIGYLNVTHTLTVTHTMTSLISQSEGAITQTLILTNRHTSTVVDIVTEVYTQVQPTTIVETVTKHIPISNVDPTHVQIIPEKTVVPLDDLTMSSEENENLIVKEIEKVTTENIIQKIETENEGDNDTFFVVMNKSQNGGKAPPIATDIETGDYDITRNEQVNNGVSQVLFGEILLAGTPYLETSNVVAPGIAYMKECQPDCKASRNERCQRIDGMMKCVCRPGFARMFPDRPCKPTYTYSVKLALGSQGQERLKFNEKLYDNTSKEYHALAVATHEGINRMVMQSDLRDVYHGVHITGFQPVDVKKDNGESYQGVMNNFYVQLSDNAHESRLKEVIEKYLRNNNYSLGGIDVHAAGELVDRLDVSDFDECTSGQFHDCSEHAQCFNLRGTYTCSCLEGFADLSVNNLYPGRICSAEPVGCELCNYHGACYSRDDRRVLCECFQWYAGSTCHINLKVVLISLVVLGALLTIVLTVCAIVACRRPRPPPRSIVTCIQGMPSFQQGAMPKQRADRRALISDRTDSGDASSVQNASLPYMPTKRVSPGGKKLVLSEPPAHEPPPVPAPAVMIPRARLHPHHADSRENISRKKSMELSSEAKLISYLESGAVCTSDEMRRKHSMESSYSANKDRHNKQGALVSAGFKVSTTIRAEEQARADERDDGSSINKNDLEAELHFDSLRKSYSQEDLSEWTDAERRIGELTLSEARSVGGTLPASTGRATSSTRLTHQEANTMAERDLGSTFLLPHVHLYKPDLTSDVSEFDSL